MKKIGYARVSSKSQNIERQILQLKNAEAEIIFEEKISGKDTNRPELIALLSVINPDDEVIICGLDRLGRNSNDIKHIMQKIRNKGATLNILNLPSFQNIENSNLRDLLNSLIIDLFSYVAENERITLLERQREGIEIAKAKGIYKGRKPKFHCSHPDLLNAINLYENKSQNKLTVSQIAAKYGMSRSTLHRKIKECRVGIEKK